MKTTKVLSVIMAFIMLVIISGCSSEMAVKTNNEDEITESTKFNTAITETLTEATEATTHPWGARSFQFRDPDGNIINFRTVLEGKGTMNLT
jgi:uncharacterized glyoxalase superfamily protein PhnB